MTDRLDGCSFQPQDNKLYEEGQDLGNRLSLGGDYVDEVYGKLIKTFNNIDLNSSDKNTAALQKADIIAGMSCKDPTDVVVEINGNHKSAKVYWDAEVHVNEVFGRLNSFSKTPLSIYHEYPKVSLEQTLINVNSYLKQHLHGDSAAAQRFMDDFNRRRNDNWYLPNFEAYKDPSGQVKVRQVGTK